MASFPNHEENSKVYKLRIKAITKAFEQGNRRKSKKKKIRKGIFNRCRRTGFNYKSIRVFFGISLRETVDEIVEFEN